MVDPLPDEPALAARVTLEQRLVVGEAARPVAHRVPVLAQDERHPPPAGVQIRVVERGLVTAPDRVDLLVRRVHAAVDVDVTARPVVLVVQRPRRIAPARPRRHRPEIAPRPALIAERPHDHRRMVLVALDRPPHAVHQRVLPLRVVARVPAPVDDHEAVRLEVALVDHVQAELVAQREEQRMRRIVARAHRVDVVRLHQLDVAPHHLLGDRPPGQRVELVPVDAVELHPVPIDLQQPVLDHHPAEADRQQHALAGARHHAVVEPRDLGAPRLDALDDHGLAARGVDAQLGHGDPHVGARRIDAQPALTRHVVEVGVHEHVLDRSLRRPRLEPDLTEDPRHPPHVLVLEIRARRPLVHAHREHVRLTRAQRLADRELDR